MQEPVPSLSADLYSAIMNSLEKATVPANLPINSLQGTSAISGLLPGVTQNLMNNAAALQIQSMIQQNLPMFMQQQQPNISPPQPTKKKAGPGRPKGSSSALNAAIPG